MYLDLYDEKHRSLSVKSDASSKEVYTQQGEREFLLCGKCEGHLAEFERYAAPIVKSLLNLEAEHAAGYYSVKNIDYQHFKLFQMSVLWRASVASIEMFRKVALGPREEHLRSMILSDNPGTPEEYGCLMLIMEKTKYLHRIIWSPVTENIDGHTIYRFETGRLFWLYFLPNHKIPAVAEYFLDKSGNLLVPIAPWSEEDVIKRLAGKIAEAKKLRKGGT